jgi:hypothetical protein
MKFQQDLDGERAVNLRSTRRTRNPNVPLVEMPFDSPGDGRCSSISEAKATPLSLFADALAAILRADPHATQVL